MIFLWKKSWLFHEINHDFIAVSWTEFMNYSWSAWLFSWFYLENHEKFMTKMSWISWKAIMDFMKCSHKVHEKQSWISWKQAWISWKASMNFMKSYHEFHEKHPIPSCLCHDNIIYFSLLNVYQCPLYTLPQGLHRLPRTQSVGLTTPKLYK